MTDKWDVTEDDKYIARLWFKMGLGIATVFWIIIFIVIIFLFFPDSAHAEPVLQDTLITFTDGADLRQQLHEIRVACDTVEVYRENYKWGDARIHYEPGVPDSLLLYIWDVVRCRVNVQIQWYKNPKTYSWRADDKQGGIHIKTHDTPGEALITWEWTE